MYLIKKNYDTDQSQFIYTLRDMYKEVIKGINTKTRVRGSRVKYFHKP